MCNHEMYNFVLHYNKIATQSSIPCNSWTLVIFNTKCNHVICNFIVIVSCIILVEPIFFFFLFRVLVEQFSIAFVDACVIQYRIQLTRPTKILGRQGIGNWTNRITQLHRITRALTMIGTAKKNIFSARPDHGWRLVPRYTCVLPGWVLKM